MSYESDPGWQYLRESRDKQIAAQSRPYDSKKNVWIPDEEDGFVEAEIKATKGDMTTVQTAKGEKTVKKDLVQEMNPPKFEKAEDMSNLTFLNEASVLYNLRSRYVNMLIYTYSGLFCVVINPYKRLPIYTDSVVAMYQNKRKNEMPPHLFMVAEEAYANMKQDGENQSLLITGESGAGKTENTKKVLTYFALVGASQAKGKEKAKGGTLEEQIVQMNPALEAYGNAKTVRNNNSSRFGKFIRTHFSKAGKLAGCDIEHYLLEKSRVIKQAPGERCYHIFYQIFSDQIPGLKEKLLFDHDLRYYHFVSQAELTIDGVDDKEEMQMTDESFDVMGFDQAEKSSLYRICSAMMHMGEMKFKQRPREEQAEADGTEECEKASKMYGINAEDFMKAILKPRVKVGTEWVNKGQNLEQVNWGIGAMAKGVYDRMFTWLIHRCNKTLDAKEIQRDYFMGVLDIAGFEIFDFNSFEQIWINFVNEKLQQFFNHHMFVLEQEEYKREQINWTFIDFGLDLAACIQLIEMPMGIISMLDEECIVPKATDLTYAQKLTDMHLGKHPNFQKPKPPKGKQAEAHFALVHYAGTVRYNVTAWLEKNKDPLNDTCVSVMKATKENQLLLDCWASYTTQEERAEQEKKGGATKKKGKSASFNTVSMLYREGLNSLMHMLHATHPHFVRCIIPNEIKKSGYLDAALVMNQLTCNGVLEGIRICRKGFPNRMIYPDFRHRYAIIAAAEAKSSKDEKEASLAILERMKKDNVLAEGECLSGLTKVFFRAGILAKLEDVRDETLARIVKKFQSQVRWYHSELQKKKLHEQKAGLVIIQRNVRSWCTLRTWEWFKFYGRVKPLIKGNKANEEAEKLAASFKELEEKFANEEKKRKELESANVKLLEEKNALHMQLQNEKGSLSEQEQKLAKLNSTKTDLERQIEKANDAIADQEAKNEALAKAKKNVEKEVEQMKKNVTDLEMNIRKQEQEKQSKDHHVKSLQDEMAQQDELISKLNKEKKHQEEMGKKLTEDLQAEEDKVNHLNKVKSKLEQTLDELEDNLEKERKSKQDMEKAKRKVEGDLKVLQETLDEAHKQKADLDNNLKKKEGEYAALSSRLEDEQNLVAKLQRQIKELTQKVQELQDELDAERQSRSKAEKAKSELQRELEELGDRLDEAGGATSAQIELNKKREAEMAKLRHYLEEANMNHEGQMSAIRKKHNDAVAEMGEQLEQLQFAKAKWEKEKAALQREVEEAHMALDAECKSKANAEKTAKLLENQVADLQARSEEQARQIGEYNTQKARLLGESADLSRHLEEAESQVNQLSRLKSQLQQQVEEARRTVDDEVKERHNVLSQLRALENETSTLRTQFDEECDARAELQRLLSKANGEVQSWRAKFESEGVARLDEIEEAKRKLQGRVSELQESLEAANTRIMSLDKTRVRLQGEVEDAQIEADRANQLAASFEKKQKGFDKIIDEWKKKVEDLRGELDANQRESRNLSMEVFRLKNAVDEANEQSDALRRENKTLAQEIKDMTDQLGEGGRSVHELQKLRRRLELEKEELQIALDEAEAALEAEEAKVLRAQVEVSQIRQEIEKRIHDKEEEFENTRKNHQRALESMQATLEAETKGRNDLLRLKKKLETDINDLEINLDHANRANAEAQKTVQRQTEQIRDLLAQLEELQHAHDELRNSYDAAERRCYMLNGEKEDLRVSLEQSERGRRKAESDATQAQAAVDDLTVQTSALTAQKRKYEQDVLQLQGELDEAAKVVRSAEEGARKAMADAARIAAELRQEQEHSLNVDRARKGLELQIKDLQARLDEAEQAALKGGRRLIQKLEQKLTEVQADMDNEQRRHQESLKALHKQDRRVRELQFQVEEDKKNEEKLHEFVDKLHNKLRIYKRQIEDAEQVAMANLAKYRGIAIQLNDAEERASNSENALAKLRARGRTQAAAVVQAAAAEK